MKKTIYTLLVMILVGGLVAMGQIKPIKRQHSTKQKTEKMSKKPKQKSSSSDSGKSKKTNKASSQQSSNLSTEMTQAQKDRIIQKAIDDMVWVDGGTFIMGATPEQGESAFKAEKPAHQVTLNGYYIGRYEVTQELWQAVMGTSIRQQCNKADDPYLHGEGASFPIYNVSWDDCQEFIHKLNQLTGRYFRLPTEAEWEYAARGGNQSRGYKYSGSNNVGSVAWCYEYSSMTTHPVGRKSPNELGLFDMSGNVCEWCQDWCNNWQFNDDYTKSPSFNPTGPISGYKRALRGGGWTGEITFCRVSCRYCREPSIRDSRYGLRLAMSPY